MGKDKTGVLILNLGTPDSPKVSDVRRYLTEFLNDPRVIDLPWLGRKLLVNLIIVPFRSKKSSKIYKELWDEKGSPLLYHSQSVCKKLQHELGDDYQVELAMRYQNPSMDDVLERMRQANYKKIIILPLYPQYASSSTGSSLEKAMKIINKWWVIPELKVINQFYDNDGYINTILERTKAFNLDDYDHILFSYHGLPIRHVDKVYDNGPCADHNCENEITEENKHCYKATCYATTRLLVEKLGIPKEKYTVGFQSRLTKNWIQPFSDEVIIERAKIGAKKILVFSPAFTADCLETTIEIGDEYQELFEEHGGEKIDLVPSLNDHPMWVDALKEMVKE